MLIDAALVSFKGGLLETHTLFQPDSEVNDSACEPVPVVTDTPVVPDGEAESVETQAALELAWVFDSVATDAALDSDTGAVVDTSEVNDHDGAG